MAPRKDLQTKWAYHQYIRTYVYHFTKDLLWWFSGDPMYLTVQADNHKYGYNTVHTSMIQFQCTYILMLVCKTMHT